MQEVLIGRDLQVSGGLERGSGAGRL